MTTFRVWLARVAGLFQSRRRDRALDEEMQAHLDELTDELVARGVPYVEAITQARRQFGGVEQIKAQYRDQRGWPVIDTLRYDIALAFRQAWRERRTTSLAALTLGSGIAVSMAFFTIVNAICIRGLPIDRPEQVLYLASRDADANETGMSYADFLDVRRSATSLDGVAAYTPAAFNMTDGRGAALRLAGCYVSAGAFAALGVEPLLGRDILRADEVDGAPAIVLISQAVWTSRYGGDRAIVGQSVRVDGAEAVIVGVMPAGFHFPGQADAWKPLASQPGIRSQPRSVRNLAAFARVSDSAGSWGASAELAGLARELASRYPDTNAGVDIVAGPINERFNGRLTDPVWLAFLTAGLLVLLVACANVANLQLARLSMRSREVALRRAIGATRFRIVRQMLLEAAVIAAFGGLVGLVLATGAVRLLAWSVPASAPLPYWIAFDVDLRVLSALVGTCAACVLFVGIAPAFQGSRVGVNHLLKDGGRYGMPSRRARRVTGAFLAVQFALTLVLLANVSSDLRGEVLADDAGIELDATSILTARITLPPATYGTAEERSGFFTALDERLRGAGIASFAVTTQLPPEPGRPMRLRLPERPLGPGEEGERVFVASIGPRFFETLGVPLVAGRELETRDGGEGGVVVSRHLAERTFGSRSAIGRRVALAEDGRPDAEPVWRTIIGVVPDLEERVSRAMVYVPHAGAPASAVLLLSSAGPLETLVPLLQQVIGAIDPDLPVYRAAPLAVAQYESRWMGRVSAAILRSIASVALVLAVIGLYAVIAQSVSQRKHEIGIRVALGAAPRRVMVWVLRRAVAYVSLGLGVGVPATYLYGRAFLDGTTAPILTSPANLLPVAALVIVVCLVACLRPIFTAMRVDPAAVLKAD